MALDECQTNDGRLATGPPVSHPFVWGPQPRLELHWVPPKPSEGDSGQTCVTDGASSHALFCVIRSSGGFTQITPLRQCFIV